MNNQIIIITGMHRSGTSLTASWLQKCGVRIDNGRMMDPGIGNPKGHFEDEDFVDLQSQSILANFQGSKGWIVHEKHDLRFKGEFLDKAKGLIKNHQVDSQSWGWKDPRSVLFLNQWKSIIPESKFVFVWREANEVVSSLKSRFERSGKFTDKIKPSVAFKTWLNYNSAILSFVELYPEDCVLLKISTLLENDREVLDLINDRFQTHLDYTPIETLTEPNLLLKRKLGLVDNLYGRLLGVKKLEERLELWSNKDFFYQ